MQIENDNKEGEVEWVEGKKGMGMCNLQTSIK